MAFDTKKLVAAVHSFNERMMSIKFMLKKAYKETGEDYLFSI